MMTTLPKSTLYVLQNRQYENETKLNEVEEQLKNDYDYHEDLIEQRETLVAGYVKSQKLAFALAKANY